MAIVQSILDLCLTLLGSMDEPSSRIIDNLKIPQFIMEKLAIFFDIYATITLIALECIETMLHKQDIIPGLH